MTKVSAFINIYSKTAGQSMSEERVESIRKEVEYLNGELELNAVQCMMVAVMLKDMRYI